MTSPQDPELLEQLLRDAFAQRANTTTIGAPFPALMVDTETAPQPDAAGSDTPHVEVLPLVATEDPPRPTRRWLRPAVTAAAVVAILAALVVVDRVVDDRDGTMASQPEPPPLSQPGPVELMDPPSTPVNCGTELPFELPVPDGLEGPVTAPATPTLDQNELWAGTVLRWQSDDTILDVYWPSWRAVTERVAPTEQIRASELYTGETPLELGPYGATEVPDQWSTQIMEFETTALGAGGCDTVGIAVSTPYQEPIVDGDLSRPPYDGSPDAIVDQIALDLVGPDGVLPGTKPTPIVGSTDLDTLDELELCGTQPAYPDDVAESQRTQATPEDALAYYLPTNTTELPLGGYLHAVREDGSHAFAYAPADASTGTIGDYPALVNVEEVDGGWAVTSYETAC
jgi:hypothetical protein